MSHQHSNKLTPPTKTSGLIPGGKPWKRRTRTPQSLTHPKVLAKLASMPATYRPTYPRAVGGNDLRAAVHAFCAECVQWQPSEVTRCTSPACPLFPYRPYQLIDPPDA